MSTAFFNLKGQCNFQVFNNFACFKSLYMTRTHIIRIKNESRRHKQIEAPSNYKTILYKDIPKI